MSEKPSGQFSKTVQLEMVHGFPKYSSSWPTTDIHSMTLIPAKLVIEPIIIMTFRLAPVINWKSR